MGSCVVEVETIGLQINGVQIRQMKSCLIGQIIVLLDIQIAMPMVNSNYQCRDEDQNA